MKTNKKHHTKTPLGFPDKTGFKVPRGYFETLEDDFSSRLIEEKLPNSSGFEVPETYFESFEQRLFNRIEGPKETKVISLRSKILKVSTIAAAFLLLFTGYWFTSIKDNRNDPSFEEIALWVDHNIDEIHSLDIIHALDENLEFTEVDLLEESLNTNTIDSYFDQNDTYILIEESQGLFDEIN